MTGVSERSQQSSNLKDEGYNIFLYSCPKIFSAKIIDGDISHHLGIS
ncbi:hypothetical protein ACK3F5_17190 [Photorhabdus asymbiotica UENP]